LFDSFKMRRPFLAGGYRGSGKAFWQKGEPIQALKLFLRAVWLDPIDFGQSLFRGFRRSHVYQMVIALFVSEV
jgi:hypothetical protein